MLLAKNIFILVSSIYVLFTNLSLPNKNLISILLPFSLLSSITGMLILFSLLTIQIIPLESIRRDCHILLKI